MVGKELNPAGHQWGLLCPFWQGKRNKWCKKAQTNLFLHDGPFLCPWGCMPVIIRGRWKTVWTSIHLHKGDHRWTQTFLNVLIHCPQLELLLTCTLASSGWSWDQLLLRAQGSSSSTSDTKCKSSRPLGHITQGTAGSENTGWAVSHIPASENADHTPGLQVNKTNTTLFLQMSCT